MGCPFEREKVIHLLMHFKKWIYKIWVDKDSEFYSRAIKSYIEDNDIKFNNTYHRKIKLKPIVVKNISYINFDVESNIKDPKLVIMWEYQNTKIFL